LLRHPNDEVGRRSSKVSRKDAKVAKAQKDYPFAPFVFFFVALRETLCVKSLLFIFTTWKKKNYSY
jgi:hypothetical protein